MKSIVRLLNRLSILKMDVSERASRTVGFLLLGIVAVLCLLMAVKVEKKLAFIIDSVELSGHSPLTLGEGSTICYQDVPHDYLTLTYEDGQFSWRVNEQYHDTLQYFKINDKNPNAHIIENDESQLITMRLPYGERDTLRLTLSGADIWKTWKKFRRQKDVMVRHFATYYQLNVADADEPTRKACMDQMRQHAVRSFFEKNGHQLKIVILDDLTTVSRDGKETGYMRSGTATTDGGRSGRCKVQFFRLNEYCYMNDRPERGYFHIDGVNYVMKATVKLTEWGAGHVMVTPKEQTFAIHFPHAISYVGTVDTLRKKSAGSSQVITLKQENNSFPSKSDLYLPAFSNAIGYDLCNIEFFHGKDSVVVSDNHHNAHCVENATTGFLPFSILPSFSKVDLHCGQDILHCRLGYINGSFIMSYLWLPLLVCLFVLLMIWLPFSSVRLTKRQLKTKYCSYRLEHYPLYLTMLTLVCMAYCVCKSLIAMKLSYSYPYFEELTGITPFSTSCMMLLFFSLAMLLNTPLRHAVGEKNKAVKLHVTWLLCTALFALLVFTFFRLADTQINQGVISSYFRNEVFDFNPFRWMDRYGINDTHRSVVYALFLVEAGVLVLWLLTNLFWTPIRNVFDAVTTWWGKCSEQVSTMFARWWGKISHPDYWSRLSMGKGRNRFMNELFVRIGHLPVVAAIFVCSVLFQLFTGFSVIAILLTLLVMVLVFIFNGFHEALLGALKVLFPSHVLLLIVLGIIGNYSGRFGTAFVTLLVVLGLSEALTSVSISKDGKRRHVLFCQMCIISIFYIIGAMMGDNGYMTNYMGFAMGLVCFYFLMKRPVAYANSVYKEAKNEGRWVNFLLVVLAVLLFAMPYLCSHMFSPEKVNYGRIARRVMLYANFSDLERSGYRYSESDAEFMVIMSHYMQRSEGHDPLSNDDHFLHPSVSSGQSPVAINDLSMPMAFFGSYGLYMTTAVFFLLLLLLGWLVMNYSLTHEDPNYPSLTRAMQWRLLSMFMWLGTSFYIYLSYIDRLPFTGRLIPGFGVDAVGEVLETSVLLAFMAAVTCRKAKPIFRTS